MITDPYPHQVEGAKEVIAKLKAYALCYLAWEERTGKTLTAVLAIEELKVKTVLVITKKTALAGWKEALTYPHKKIYTVINYHQLKNISRKHDMIVLDEAHNYISGIPKPSEMCKLVARHTSRKPILFLSATPCAQGPAQLYHQFRCSTWTPWKRYATFYKWHKVYGKPYKAWLYEKEVPKYDRTHDSKVWADVSKFFIFKTRKELGFEHEPEDKVHYVELDEDTKFVYNAIVKDKVYKFLCGAFLIGDTVTKIRYALHMLEGGGVKIDDEYIVLGNTEKIDYIKKMWGDSKDLVIMYNFKVEKIKLEAHFKNARILQATTFAEGVDLHEYKNMVIYSQDYSTARHTQRRARQANKKRKEEIIIHFLLVKNGLSEAVYTTVSINKKNYVDSMYENRRL